MGKSRLNEVKACPIFFADTKEAISNFILRQPLFVSLPAAGLGEGVYGTKSQPTLTEATGPLNRHSAPFHSHSRPSYNCCCKESA